MTSELNLCNWCGMSEQSCGDEACPQRTRSVPDVPELKRFEFRQAEFLGGDNTLETAEGEDADNGEYVRHDQASEIIAAKDAEIDWLNKRSCDNGFCNTDHWYDRAKAAEAELAQYESQKPVCFISDECADDMKNLGLDYICADLHREQSMQHPSPLYTAPVASDDDMKAEVSKEIDGYIELYKNQDKVSRSHVLKGLSELRNRINKKGESNV